MRLQKYIAECGVASRRAAEKMIAKGRVSVNGKLVETLGFQIDPEKDIVKVDSERILPEKKKYYIMLNKPKGYITTVSDQFGRPTVLDLVRGDVDARIYPVGRLDYDTEGLLILTNDGEFANRLMHPRHEIKKEYIAHITGALTQAETEMLRGGVVIEGYKTAPARVEVLKADPKKSEVKITIHEGRNRQVRKMFEAVGHRVVSLKRIAIGNVRLGNLPLGKWRHLSGREIAHLTDDKH